MSTELTIGEHEYAVGKLDAMRQLHLTRRLLPILQTLIPAFIAYQANGENQDLSNMSAALAPALEALSSMKDDDMEYVVGTCLSVVKRRGVGNAMFAVWDAREKKFVQQFEDTGLQEMLQLTWEVIGANLGSFMQGSGLAIPAPR
jgi:hypothetical protein